MKALDIGVIGGIVFALIALSGTVVLALAHDSIPPILLTIDAAAIGYLFVSSSVRGTTNGGGGTQQAGGEKPSGKDGPGGAA